MLTLFRHPRFKGCIQRNPDDLPTISTSIIDPLHPASEPPYLLCINTFDGWFGILFKDTKCFTHVRSPHPSEILRLYRLFALIPLYPCTISVFQIHTLVLYTLPFCVSKHVLPITFFPTLFRQLSLRLLTFIVPVIALHYNHCQLRLLGIPLIN